ncbi:MAG: tetratricopeptide repeat protein [Gammaproteobacteria bacterium]|nr:tetratricopeptide repeat protein [Gammaproteobacteria bacterium]
MAMAMPALSADENLSPAVDAPEHVDRLLEPPKMDFGIDADGSKKSRVAELPPAHVIIDAVSEEFRKQTGSKPRTEDIVGALNRSTIGLVYDHKYRLAERVAQAALDLAERALGNEHPNTLVSINNLASLHSLQGRFDAAEPLLKRALKTSKKVLGEEHPNTLTSINALAFLYEARGRHDAAEPLLARILEIRERTLGNGHADTRRSVDNLANLYLAQGRYREAEALHARASRTNREVLGEKHLETRTTQLALAITHINNREFTRALQLLWPINIHLREVIDALSANDREETAHQGWLLLQSGLHDVIFSLAMMDLPADVQPDAQRLAAGILLSPNQPVGEGDDIIAHLARIDNEQSWEGVRAAIGEIPLRFSRFKYTYRDRSAARGIDWSQVAVALPPDSALLLSRAFHPIDLDTRKAEKQHWLGLVISAGQGGDDVEMIFEDLGSEASVESSRAEPESGVPAPEQATAKFHAALSRYRYIHVVLDVTVEHSD